MFSDRVGGGFSEHSSGLTEIRATLEDTLGPETFAAHHAKGVMLSLDEVVTLAAATAATVPD